MDVGESFLSTEQQMTDEMVLEHAYRMFSCILSDTIPHQKMDENWLRNGLLN